jgi:phosphatidylglycerophosphate synthase
LEKLMSALNLPNLLTLTRLVCAPIIPLSVLAQWNPLWPLWNTEPEIGIFALAVFLGCTDMLDGACAKWLKQETAFGKWLDPIADFFYCLCLFISVFVIYTRFPVLQIAWVIFAAYFAWYAEKVSQLRRSGKISGPNMDAKFGMCALMISLLLVILGTFALPVFVWHMLAILCVTSAILLTLNALDEYQKPFPCVHCTCAKTGHSQD